MGGKSYLQNVPKNLAWKPLPGGSGLQWGVEKLGGGEITICIIDPVPVAQKNLGPFRKPARPPWMFAGEYEDFVTAEKHKWQERKNGKVEMIGRLSLEKFKGPIKNAYSVEAITVDESRRGIGIAKALYGIVLSVMGATLVSGDSQTPGGRRNWLSLASIPGVEVKGLLSINDDEFGPRGPLNNKHSDYEKRGYDQSQKNADATIDMLMQLGFQYVGEEDVWGDTRHYFAFDVTGGEEELAPAVKNKLSQIYGSYKTLLYARWTGKK